MTFEKQLIATQQGRLADLGYYTGPIDGIAGPRTQAAMADMKGNNGLLARPFPGELTMARLWSAEVKRRPKPSNGSAAPWLDEARRLLGTKEYAGRANNPEIMGWARDLDQWYPGDDVPWCGLFVGHCMAVGAPQEPQTFNRLGAREWLKFGVETPKGAPALGAVCVLWRGRRDGWQGHVFIVTGVSKEGVRGIGGNQSNNVTEAWFSKDRVLGYRQPEGVSLKAAPVAKTGTFSQNEA